MKVTLEVRYKRSDIELARLVLDAMEAQLEPAAEDPDELEEDLNPADLGITDDLGPLAAAVRRGAAGWNTKDEDEEVQSPVPLPGTRHQARHLRVAKYLAKRQSTVTRTKIADALNYEPTDVSGSLQYLARHGLVRRLAENSHRWKATAMLKERGVIGI